MEPKPCPFCGGMPKIKFIDHDGCPWSDTPSHYSLSHICKGKGGNYERIMMSCGIQFQTEEDAIAHWNRRVKHDS